MLGLHGDIGSVPVLTHALAAGHDPALQAAAAGALGEVGVPTAVPVLVGSLRHPRPEVRAQVALALHRLRAGA